MATLSVAQSGYAETGTGYVTATPGLGAAQLKAAFQYDLTGRQITQIEYTGDGTGYAGSGYGYFYNVPPSSIANYRYSYYDNAGRVTRTLDIARQGSDTIQTDTTNQYGANQYGVTTAGYALGAVLSSVASTFKNDVFQQSATTTTAYDWYDAAVQKTVSYQANAGQPVFTTSYTDSGTGVLRSAHIGDGRPRDVTVTSDVFGQAIRRDEVDQGSGGDPHELWYRFDGRQLGYVGNNGTLNGDYTGSIAQRTAAVPSGAPAAFRGGATAGSPAADFDQAYDAINSYAQGSGGGGSAGSYAVRAGDTLAGIATQLWGDASLWYKLAQANGLTGDSGLTAGTTLAIPGGVSRSGNSAATFRPYDPGDAYGDTSPTTPRPQAAKKGNNCGVFGQILLVAVAVAVTIVSYGSLGPVGAAIAGNVASQGVGLATGIQQTFDFRSVALSGIAGGVAQGLGAVIGETAVFGSEVATAAVTGALASAITQGIGVTIGLQSKFDFVGVAAAGLGAGAGQALGGSFAKLGKVGSRLAVNTAGGLVNATVRSLASGTDFGDNLIAALPDVIGQTIGGLAAEGIGGSRSLRSAASTNGGQDQPGPIDPALRAAIDNFNVTGRASAIPSAAASAPIAVAGGGQVDESGDIVVTADKNALAQARQNPSARQAANAVPDNYNPPRAETYSVWTNSGWRAQFEVDNEAHFKATGRYYDDANSIRQAYQDREAQLMALSAYETGQVDQPLGLFLGGTVTAALGGAFVVPLASSLGGIGTAGGLLTYGGGGAVTNIAANSQYRLAAGGTVNSQTVMQDGLSGYAFGVAGPIAGEAFSLAGNGVSNRLFGGVAGESAPTFGEITTAYGPAFQSPSFEALAARSTVEDGATLYRLGTIGRSDAAEAQFWAMEHPLNPGYAARYGIPPENVAKFDFIESATLKPGTPFVTRPAPGIGNNPGGGIEVVVPRNGVTMKHFGGH